MVSTATSMYRFLPSNEKIIIIMWKLCIRNDKKYVIVQDQVLERQEVSEPRQHDNGI